MKTDPHRGVEERLTRIAELLLGAIARSPAAPQVPIPIWPVQSDTSRQILEALKIVECAAPAQLLSLVPVSRATLARELRALLAQGMVQRTGRTRRARYALLLGKHKKTDPMHSSSNSPAKSFRPQPLREVPSVSV